jgi:hypothetical protein
MDLKHPHADCQEGWAVRARHPAHGAQPRHARGRHHRGNHARAEAGGRAVGRLLINRDGIG